MLTDCGPFRALSCPNETRFFSEDFRPLVVVSDQLEPRAFCRAGYCKDGVTDVVL